MVSYKCPDHPVNTGTHSLTPAHAEALPAPELFHRAARERRPAILTQLEGLYARALRELAEALA